MRQADVAQRRALALLVANLAGDGERLLREGDGLLQVAGIQMRQADVAQRLALALLVANLAGSFNTCLHPRYEHRCGQTQLINLLRLKHKLNQRFALSSFAQPIKCLLKVRTVAVKGLCGPS